MIKQIRLIRFKKFPDVSVSLQPFTILMGENSSGKTSIIQAINLALNTFSRYGLVYEDRQGKIAIKKRGVGLTILPGLSVADFRDLYYGRISRGANVQATGDGNIGAIIELTDNDDNVYKLQVSSLFGGFNLKCISQIGELSNNPTLHFSSPLFISGFIGLRSTEERSFPVAIRDRLLSGEASTIIRNLVLDIKMYSPNKYERLKNRLEQDFGFYLDAIDFDERKDLYVTAHYRETCGQNRLSMDFSSSGSGFMQILQILTPIYYFCPDINKIVLLDEPDAHLHPNLQATLARTLRDIQKELKIQIIISTHSTSIIRSANPNEVIPIASNIRENLPLSTQEDVEQEIIGKIDTYELGKSVISGKLIFIEDSNIDILEAFDKISQTYCFSGANTVPVICGRGKDDKIPFHLSQILKEYLHRDVEIHFIRDGDGLDVTWRERIAEFSKRNKVIIHHLEYHEIENYILKPELIYRALTAKYPDLEVPSIEDIKNKIIELLKNTVTLNRYGFDDNLEDSIYKTAMLLSISEFRNSIVSKGEAVKLEQDMKNLILLMIL